MERLKERLIVATHALGRIRSNARLRETEAGQGL